MNQKTDSIFTYIFYFSIAAVFLFTFIQNIENPWLLLLLFGLVAISVTLRNAVIYPSVKYSRMGMLLILLDLLLIFFIHQIDSGNNSGIMFYILIADCCLAYPLQYTGLITFLSFIAYRLPAGHSDKALISPQSLSQTGQSLLSFLGFLALMYIIKYELYQRGRLKAAMHELKVKSWQLENTYMKLRKASEELEALTIVAERNRIAREIHDTVGHTLTTVLMELEAGDRLIEANPQTAREKLRLAKEQVRKGLQDIRESVRTLQSGSELLEFVPALRLLIEETTRHGEINIKYDIGELPGLTQAQEKAIYRALQEGLTNGIRHGGSTAFAFCLRYENQELKFMLQDNGKGTDTITRGFGLTAMEERIKELGGTLLTQSSLGEGFQISIAIPAWRD